MSFTVDQAYAQIKSLENSGQLNLPEPQDTVEVGSINATTGEFEWAVTTITQTTTLAPLPGGPDKTNSVVNVTVGLVNTNAVDLLLKFNIVATEPKAVGRFGLRAEEMAVQPEKEATAGILAASGSGIIIAGFPTLSSTSSEILVDAGMACSVSQAQTAPNQTPPVSTFSVTITIPGHPSIGLELIIVRPPVLGMGAFTIPALPMAIVYAPPQGKQAKNSATYSNMTSLSRKVTTSITSSTSTKTAQAYSVADIITKVAASIAAVAAVVGTGGAAAGVVAGAAAAGALGGTSGAKDATDDTSNDLKSASSALSLVSNVLNALPESTTSDTQTLTTETDNTITLTVSETDMFTSSAGLGPGVGDRIVYLKNVRVFWAAVNGEIGINILGYEALSADSVQSLMEDQKTLASGGTAGSGLDTVTIGMLLNLDPFCVKRPPLKPVLAGPPLVSWPRFAAATPPERSGEGTGTTPDQFSVSYDLSTDDRESQTSVQSSITDSKPSWVSVLFGGSDVETTTTMTLTTNQVLDTTTDNKVTNTVSLFSVDASDPYDILIFFDRTFGTFLFADKGASVLQGDPNAGELTANPLGNLQTETAFHIVKP